MAEGTLIVEGLKPLVRDLSRVSREIGGEIRKELAAVAAPVAIDAKLRLGPFGARTAAGVRVSVRQTGVSVRQSMRKSPRLALRRPNFGGLQMQKAFEPALDDNAANVERRMEEFLDRLAGEF